MRPLSHYAIRVFRRRLCNSTSTRWCLLMHAIRGIYPLDGTINCLPFTEIKDKSGSTKNPRCSKPASRKRDREREIHNLASIVRQSISAAIFRGNYTIRIDTRLLHLSKTLPVLIAGNSKRRTTRGTQTRVY